EFPLDRAGCAMEPSQIYRSLFEDFGCQFLLARLEMVIAGSVHNSLIWFVISFSSVRRSRFQRISDLLRASFFKGVCFYVSQAPHPRFYAKEVCKISLVKA